MFNFSLNFNFQAVVSHSVVNDVSLKISNVCVGGLLRLSLTPLLITKPLIGGFEVCFLRPPQINFELGGSVSAITDIPG